MSSNTVSNMAPPKPVTEHWTILFRIAYETGLLSYSSCDLLGLPHVKVIPYSKNNQFKVADITFKKLQALEYNRTPNLTVDLILTTIGMVRSGEYDQQQRKKWSNQMIHFIQSSVSRPSANAVMGGSINDLLILYFEKLARKFTSKKALSGPEGIARFDGIRVACGVSITEVKEMAVKEVYTVKEAEETKTEVQVEISFNHDIPDNWDDE